MTTFVLVHGAWGRPDDWTEVVEALDQRGPVIVADLPTCRGPASLADDIAHVRALVESAGDDVVLVGHSYGGVVITGVDSAKVRHLVYVAAFMLDESETVVEVMTAAPSRDGDWIEFGDDGLCTILPDLEADRINYSPAAFDRLHSRERRRWSFMAGSVQPPHVAWRATPSTYVVAKRDTIVTPSLQERFASRAKARHEFDVDHAVAYEVPGELAEIIAAV